MANLRKRDIGGAAVEASGDGLRDVMPSSPPKKKTLRNPLLAVSAVVRTVAGFVYLATIGLPLLWLIVLLRPLNPLLMQMGIKTNNFPTEIASRYFAKALLFFFGFNIKVEGLEYLPENDPVILMYAHSSNLDPFVLLASCPIPLKFLFKKSLLYTAPYLLPLGLLYGHIPIDRSKRDKAIQTIEKTGRKIKKDRKSVCIAPEGQRSTTGELLPFKKGPFHLAKQSGLPIVPAMLFNANELMPPGQILPFSGVIGVRFLPPIHQEESDTVESLSDKVRQAMEESAKKKMQIQESPELAHRAIALLCMMAVFLFLLLA